MVAVDSVVGGGVLVVVRVYAVGVGIGVGWGYGGGVTVGHVLSFNACTGSVSAGW